MDKKREKLKITEWAIEDRPREKMMLHGIRALSNAELIAILIGSRNVDETAVELSQRILNSAGNSLNNLGKYGMDDFVKPFKGIGEAKAITIMAALEIGRRRRDEELPRRPSISGSADVYNLLRGQMIDLPHEEFWVLLLNRANRVIDTIKVSQGGTSATVVDVKLVMRSALQQLASAVILCHNHPSNNLKPSQADDRVTEKIRSAAALFDISVLDHIIVGEDGYFSYLDEGRL